MTQNRAGKKNFPLSPKEGNFFSEYIDLTAFVDGDFERKLSHIHILHLTT
jgi:hypothetical protein